MTDREIPELIKELRQNTFFRFFLRHVMLGFIIFITGMILLVFLLILDSVNPNLLSETAWSALLSIPSVFIVTGLLTVFYEGYVRTAFTNAIRSIDSAWDTGVKVLPSHESAPKRRDVLAKASKNVQVMSTTLYHYLDETHDLVVQKANAGVTFKFILYDPESLALGDKANEEKIDPDVFRLQVVTMCHLYLGPWCCEYPDKVQVRFCTFNTPFGITIIDEREIVLSLNVYGLARSNNKTPCLVIQNRYDSDSVFKLYEKSFEAIWGQLTDRVPDSVKSFFPNDQMSGERTGDLARGQKHH